MKLISPSVSGSDFLHGRNVSLVTNWTVEWTHLVKWGLWNSFRQSRRTKDLLCLVWGFFSLHIFSRRRLSGCYSTDLNSGFLFPALYPTRQQHMQQHTVTTCSDRQQFTLGPVQWGLFLKVAMAAGSRLFPKQALMHLIALYLCPEGIGVRWWLSGCGKMVIEWLWLGGDWVGVVRWWLSGCVMSSLIKVAVWGQVWGDQLCWQWCWLCTRVWPCNR